MPEFQLVKTSTGDLRGFTQDDQQAYARFKGWLKGLGAGEFFSMKIVRPRNYRFLKKYMAMMKLGFDQWDPGASRKRLTYKGIPIEKSFDEFRHGVMIQAGYYEAIYDARGRVQLRAKSVSFDSMDDDQFAEVYEACLKVLMNRVLTNYSRQDADHAIQELEKFEG